MNPNQTPPTTPAQKGTFNEQTKMADVLRLNPNAPWTLRQFHIGGCHHCGFDMNDSIGKVAEDHGVPAAMLVTALNN